MNTNDNNDFIYFNDEWNRNLWKHTGKEKSSVELYEIDGVTYWKLKANKDDNQYTE